jgi:hypothetical protein
MLVKKCDSYLRFTNTGDYWDVSPFDLLSCTYPNATMDLQYQGQYSMVLRINYSLSSNRNLYNGLGETDQVFVLCDA